MAALPGITARRCRVGQFSHAECSSPSGVMRRDVGQPNQPIWLTASRHRGLLITQCPGHQPHRRRGLRAARPGALASRRPRPLRSRDGREKPETRIGRSGPATNWPTFADVLVGAAERGGRHAGQLPTPASGGDGPQGCRCLGDAATGHDLRSSATSAFGGMAGLSATGEKWTSSDA
jgi:hypothetical protein